MGKLRGSAQNSAFRGKLWPLEIVTTIIVNRRHPLARHDEIAEFYEATSQAAEMFRNAG